MTRYPTRRALVTGRLPLAGLAALGGCGFQPVYMPTATGKPGPAERGLAAIHVGIIPERPGQLLRQALQAKFGSDTGVPSRYDLLVFYWINGEPIGIQPDSTATRIRVIGHANWTLVEQTPARPRLTEGSARALDGLNIFNQQFFALDLQNEAVQRRLAERLADDIATQLALWFRQRAAATG